MLRGQKVSVFLNPRQYERGALLVITNTHVDSLIHATDEQFVAMQLEARRMARALVDQLGATGVNVFQNAGVHAGQTVSHYHLHVVPRYPDSEPSKRFREADYPVTPTDHLRSLAAVLDAPRMATLDAMEGHFDREYSRNPRKWRTALGIWVGAALGAFWRIVTVGGGAWSSSTAYAFLSLGLLAGGYALATRRRRGLELGLVVSLVLLAISVALTL